MSKKEIFKNQTMYKRVDLVIDYAYNRILYAYFDKNERLVSPIFEDSL